jgi:hypothetical protein
VERQRECLRVCEGGRPSRRVRERKRWKRDGRCREERERERRERERERGGG